MKDSNDELNTSTHLSKLKYNNKEKFLALFLPMKFNVTKICQEIGVNRNTYYEWLETDPVFAARVKDQKQVLVDKAREVVMESLDKMNPNVAMFVLGKLDADFKDKIDITSNGKSVGNVINIIMPPSNDDKIES